MSSEIIGEVISQDYSSSTNMYSTTIKGIKRTIMYFDRTKYFGTQTKEFIEECEYSISNQIVFLNAECGDRLAVLFDENNEFVGWKNFDREFNFGD